MNRLGLKIAVIVIMIAFVVTLAGCSGLEKDSAAKKPAPSDSKNAPVEMEKIHKDLEKIMASLGQKKNLAQKSKQQGEMSHFSTEPKKSGPEKSQADEQSKSKGGRSESDQESEKKRPDQAAANKQMINDWQAEETSLINIHSSWNALEPKAVKDGLGMTERNDFEQILDELTVGISQQNINSSLMSAIALYGQYAKLTRIFKMPIPPDFYETKYQLLAAAAEAGNANWEQAEGRIADIKESWHRFKLQSKIKDENLLNKSEFAIEDVIRALENQQMDILVIKSAIALNNLQQIEKELQKVQSTISPK
ncbi:Uncharacterized [Syntrophomonas zehnderi OL-4]|uniref:Uncharacterized n=1 Tax=Syntrophomonas zehnderi OL-4 TaxID=690567 RepID=A0A0E4GAT6_9FIRM|nr:hypothetical protein [Syntrophomonas zehnderi]CFX68268.1 Uncharacterized [Syntrophomonas zehnderi OL-4]